MRTTVAALVVATCSFCAPWGWATTWAPQDITCPVCAEVNSFQVVMSYGSYIYRWPTRIEYVFWPHTESQYLYSCRKCRLTLFGEDFVSVGKSKKKALKTLLKEARFDKEYPDYTAIPMAQKIALAEKLYGALNKDDAFWCQFYRVKAFHLSQAERLDEAKAARLKAIELADKMIADKNRAAMLKEVYAIKGAMHAWVGDMDAARAAFKTSLSLKYTLKPEFDETAIRAAAKEAGEDISMEELKEYRQEFEEEAEATVEDMNDYLNGYAKEFLEALDSPDGIALLRKTAQPKTPTEPTNP